MHITVQILIKICHLEGPSYNPMKPYFQSKNKSNVIYFLYISSVKIINLYENSQTITIRWDKDWDMNQLTISKTLRSRFDSFIIMFPIYIWLIVFFILNASTAFIQTANSYWCFLFSTSKLWQQPESIKIGVIMHLPLHGIELTTSILTTMI